MYVWIDGFLSTLLGLLYQTLDWGVKLVQVEGLLLLQVGKSALSSLLPIFWDNVDDEKHLEAA